MLKTLKENAANELADRESQQRNRNLKKKQMEISELKTIIIK